MDLKSKFRSFCFVCLFILLGCNEEQLLKTNKPVFMKVSSNVLETDFYYREQKYALLPDEGWIYAGKGQEVQVQLFKGGRYELKAAPAGYQEKKQRFHDPEKFYMFTFYDADKKPGEATPAPYSTTSLTSSYVPIDAPAIVQGLQDSRIPISRTGRKYAVVVGISKYQYASPERMSKLLYADEDAKAFAETLLQNGWNSDFVRVLTNEQATKTQITIALESWLTKAGRDDLVVLFWSGHGFPDPDSPEKVYYACYDTNPQIPATGYRMDQIRRALEELHCRNVIIFADTCYAGSISQGGDKSISLNYIDSTAAVKEVPSGWIFMLSSDVNRTAIENTSWSHGAFTYCLLKALSGEADGFLSAGPKDGIVTMGELKSFITTVMPDETQKILGVAKHPVISASAGDPSIWEISLGGQ